MSAFPTNYRLAAVSMVVNFLGRPLILGLLTSTVALRNWSRSYHVLAYIVSIPLYWTVYVQYDVFVKKRAAAARGAILAPEINGKWIGNLDLMLKIRKSIREDYVSEFVQQWFELYPGEDTVNVRVLWQDQLFTRNHRVMQYMLATGFDEFRKGPVTKLRLFGMFGDGIFNNDGAAWKAHRALTRPFFARERVTDYEHFDKYSNKVIDILKQRSDAGLSLDVQDIFGRFTLDAAGEFLFGTSEFNTLDAPLPQPGKSQLGPMGTAAPGEYGGFVSAFEAIQVEVPRRFIFGKFWGFREMITDKSKAPNKVIDEWIRPMIMRALEAKRARGEEKMGAEDGSLLDYIADNTEDVKMLRDELMNILLAARDTTAGLLTFLFYMLAKHPEHLKKLREEILQAVPSGAPTYDDVRKLKYLRACLNETLRLFPSVPMNERSSSIPTTIPASPTPANPEGKPIFLPKANTPVRYSAMIMQRRTDLWGPDALEWKRERWFDPESIKSLTSDPFKFIPFNAGPRICLGQNFAYNEASFVVVRILQVFDTLELRQKEDAPAGSAPPESWQFGTGRRPVEEIFPRSALTLYSTGGVWMRMKAA